MGPDAGAADLPNVGRVGSSCAGEVLNHASAIQRWIGGVVQRWARFVHAWRYCTDVDGVPPVSSYTNTSSQPCVADYPVCWHEACCVDDVGIKVLL